MLDSPFAIASDIYYDTYHDAFVDYSKATKKVVKHAATMRTSELEALGNAVAIWYESFVESIDLDKYLSAIGYATYLEDRETYVHHNIKD